MFIKLPGYLIKVDVITGISDIERIEKIIKKDEKDGTKIIPPKTEIFYHLSLFFDGNKVEWFFEKEEEAKKVQDDIKNALLTAR